MVAGVGWGIGDPDEAVTVLQITGRGVLESQRAELPDLPCLCLPPVVGVL